MIERVVLGGLLAVAIYFFWTQKLRADLTALMVMLTLIVPWPHPDGEWRGILTPQEGFSGFGSTAVVMVTAMFIFGGALVKTGAVEILGARLFKAVAGREWALQTTILAVSVLTSMFINDTTVVLVLLPIILSVCRERNLSPSRYLMACAYGSLLGGQWTLIGTRSNLIISDYFRQRTGSGLGFFDFTPVAAAIFVLGALYFILFGRKVLPSHAPATEDKDKREYLTEVIVQPESQVVDKQLDELDWSKREDMEVVEVLRGVLKLSPHDQLKEGDILVMRGSPSAMGELLKASDFKLKEEIDMDPAALQRIDLVTVEALLAPRSNYAGSTLEDLNFNRTYGFTVLGISRHGRTIRRRPMTTPLQFGDSLLLLGQEDHLASLRRNPNLLLLVEESFPAVGKRKALILGMLLSAIIGLAILGWVSPVITIPVAVFITIVLGCIRIQDAYHAIDWPAVITVGGMIPFGLALEKTHTASDIAKILVEVFASMGPQITMGSILLLAIVFTQIIENAAVAIILAPLAYTVAEITGVDPKPFMVGLAICVSAGFCTPFAHESTILVMGPGHYRFKHYLQIGAVFALITWLLATWLTPMIWPLNSSSVPQG